MFFEDNIMPEQKFSIKENQKIWDAYYNRHLQEWEKENKEKLETQKWTDEEKIIYCKKLMAYNMSLNKITPYSYAYIRKKQSIQQYKPTILKFEKSCKKSFNCVTANDIEQFVNTVLKHDKLNHFYGFMRYCVINGIIENEDKDFLLSLIPKKYREICNLILKSK